MITYDVISALCKERNIAVTALEKELGFGHGSITRLKKGGSMTFARLQKVADYFGVPVDTFTKEKEDTNLDVAVEIQRLINHLTGDNSSYCNGKIMSKEGELALLNSLKQDVEFLNALYKNDNK